MSFRPPPLRALMIVFVLNFSRTGGASSSDCPSGFSRFMHFFSKRTPASPVPVRAAPTQHWDHRFEPPPAGSLKGIGEDTSGIAVALGSRLSRGIKAGERADFAQRLREHGNAISLQGENAGDWEKMTEGQVYLEAADFIEGSLNLPKSFVERWADNTQVLRRVGFTNLSDP